MLFVSAIRAPSTIHGMGLFAQKPISAHQLIWQHDPLFDPSFRLDRILALPPEVQELFSVYTYEDPLKTAHYIWCGDDARFMNHSAKPNTYEEDGRDYARVDIPAGTEITTDYATFGATVAPNDWPAECRRYAHLLAEWDMERHAHLQRKAVSTILNGNGVQPG